jgi:hypothetical protein
MEVKWLNVWSASDAGLREHDSFRHNNDSRVVMLVVPKYNENER